MTTYKVVPSKPARYGFSVVSKESGATVAGPFNTKNLALGEANLLASAAPGNRVES